MATYNKFDQFVEDLAKKVHDLSTNQLKIALSNTLPVRGNSILADITEISYTNCSSRNLTTISCEQVLGVLSMIVQDLTLTASGGTVGPFRYVVVYNDTPVAPADPLIGWYDRGSSLTLQNTEQFIIDSSQVTGIFSIS